MRAKKNTEFAGDEKSPSSTLKPSKEFLNHLKKIKKAKLSADKLLDLSKLTTSRASISLTWEAVFDYICLNESISLSNLNTLAGIIQKLVASSIKSGDLNEDNEPQSFHLDSDTLKNIEEQLKLL